jgi:hypothetical protein
LLTNIAVEVATARRTCLAACNTNEGGESSKTIVISGVDNEEEEEEGLLDNGGGKVTRVKATSPAQIDEAVCDRYDT